MRSLRRRRRQFPVYPGLARHDTRRPAHTTRYRDDFRFHTTAPPNNDPDFKCSLTGTHRTLSSLRSGARCHARDEAERASDAAIARMGWPCDEADRPLLYAEALQAPFPPDRSLHALAGANPEVREWVPGTIARETGTWPLLPSPPIAIALSSTSPCNQNAVFQGKGCDSLARILVNSPP